MSWSKWQESPGDYQFKYNEVDGVTHYLIAPLSESDPDGNHVHIKSAPGTKGGYVLCQVKENRRGVFEGRRHFLEKLRNLGINL